MEQRIIKCNKEITLQDKYVLFIAYNISLFQNKEKKNAYTEYKRTFILIKQIAIQLESIMM